MKNRFLSFLAAALLIINISGCAPLIVGGAVGALGGYAASKDTIEANTDKPYDFLWDSVRMLAKYRGVIRQENVAQGSLELETESSRVWISLVRLTQATTKVKVRARKYGFPNLQLAQDIFVRIIEGVE